MPLLKIHRILIGSGIAVCLLYTLRQVLTYVNTSDSRALIRALVAVLGAAALLVYLRSIRTL
ncbi:MAG TPA: hypothetical protein VIH59_04620 [Candidatus Tectomicrobia bacterium]